VNKKKRRQNESNPDKKGKGGGRPGVRIWGGDRYEKRMSLPTGQVGKRKKDRTNSETGEGRR